MEARARAQAELDGAVAGHARALEAVAAAHERATEGLVAGHEKALETAAGMAESVAAEHEEEMVPI